MTGVPAEPAHSTRRLVEQVMTGSWVSSTLTVNVQLFVFPLLSVAVHRTVVAPTVKVEPLGGVQVMLVTVQLSVAVAAG